MDSRTHDCSKILKRRWFSAKCLTDLCGWFKRATAAADDAVLFRAGATGGTRHRHVFVRKNDLDGSDELEFDTSSAPPLMTRK